jgi:hypothetical protein
MNLGQFSKTEGMLLNRLEKCILCREKYLLLSILFKTLYLIY